MKEIKLDYDSLDEEYKLLQKQFNDFEDISNDLKIFIDKNKTNFKLPPNVLPSQTMNLIISKEKSSSIQTVLSENLSFG